MLNNMDAPMHVVTSGSRYLDIDGLGAAVGYAEYLRNIIDVNAVAVSSAPWNESITQSVRDWHPEINTHYSQQKNDAFVLVDVSEPGFMDSIVPDESSVVEVIDHHPGYERHWTGRNNTAVTIEQIGAACTLVFERYKNSGRLAEISRTSARLLLTGILDNTLNMKAQITTDRDRTAHAQLLPFAELPGDWPARYFGECQQAIAADLESALKNDTKALTEPYLPPRFGQLVLWDASDLLLKQTQKLQAIMSGDSPWAINIVSIKDGRSYFLCQDTGTQQNLARLLGIEFQNLVARADRLWLRKEIIKTAQTFGH
jgi:DHH family